MHTPGPWTVTPLPEPTCAEGYGTELSFEVSDRDGAVVGFFVNEDSARLAGAAPVLLAALEDLLALCVEEELYGLRVNLARAVIAGARGG